jgi:hypothetical protein
MCPHSAVVSASSRKSLQSLSRSRPRVFSASAARELGGLLCLPQEASGRMQASQVKEPHRGAGPRMPCQGGWTLLQRSSVDGDRGIGYRHSYMTNHGPRSLQPKSNHRIRASSLALRSPSRLTSLAATCLSVRRTFSPPSPATSVKVGYHCDTTIFCFCAFTLCSLPPSGVILVQ